MYIWRKVPLFFIVFLVFAIVAPAIITLIGDNTVIIGNLT